MSERGDPDATRTGARGRARPAAQRPAGGEADIATDVPSSSPPPSPPSPRWDDDTALPPDSGSAEPVALPFDATTPVSTPDRSAARSGIPDRIGRFRILEQAGKGAMGVVYAAFDPELDRKVAIKLLLADAARSPEFERRLRKEAQAMAKVVHPNVVAVHDVGVHEGQAFIAMDFVKGSDLRSWVKQEARPWRETVALFVQAARGLAAAHAVGVVHRDFKPDNVLVATTPEGDTEARVADFGLASALSPTSAQDGADPFEITAGAAPASTPADSMSGAGTPAYMAPERWAGAPADPASDQFGFCVALYEALAGRRPFEADTLPALIYAIAHGDPAAPPQPSDVPGWLWRVVERGLAADPAARHPSMKALVAALEADPRPRRIAYAAGGTLAAVAVTVTLGSLAADARARAACATAAGQAAESVWNASRRETLASRFAELGTRHASDAWSRVEGGLEGYAADLEDASRAVCVAHDVEGAVPDDLHALQTDCLEVRRVMAHSLAVELETVDEATLSQSALAVPGLPLVGDCRDITRLRERPALPDDPALAARVAEVRRLVLQARMRGIVGRPADALPVAEEAVEAARSVGFAPTLAEALVALGQLQDLLGQMQAAEDSFARAVEAAAQGDDAFMEAEAWLGLLWAAGRREPARIDDLVRGATSAAEPLSDGRRLSAQREGTVAALRARSGDLDSAIEHYAHAIEIWSDIGDTSTPGIAKLTNDLGWAHHMKGDTAEAATHYRRALVLKESLLGPNHPELATTLHNLGMVARAQGQLDVAQADLERALELTEIAVGPNHPRVASVLNELAATLGDRGEHDAARELATRALAIVDAQPEPPGELRAEIQAELDRAKAR